MNFKIENEKIKIKLVLRETDLIIVSEVRDDIEIESPDLRKHTLDDSFDIGFDSGELYIKENNVKWFKFLGKHKASTLIVKIPENLKITGDVNSYSGDMKIGSIDITGSITTYCGDIFFETLETEHLKLNAYNGDVSIKKLTGGIDVTLYSGDLLIKEGFIRNLGIKSYSGDIKFQNVRFNLDRKSSITTKSGDIDIEIKDYVGTDELNLKTLSGYINISGNYPKEKVITKSLTQSFGNKKQFENIFDKIVSPFKESSTVKAKFPSTQEDKESISKVLDMLEAGKIDANKAEKLINTIRG